MINIDEVAKNYNNLDIIWDKNDKWHWYSHFQIADFIKKNVAINNDSKVLNAGSGGNNYGLPDQNVTHLDIAQKKILNYPKYVVGSIENIPIYDEKFDLIICVGSVLNYTDPVAAINEFERLSKKGTHLILEFENSKTLELIFSKNYNKKAVLRDTFYNKRKEKIWYFSEEFICEILNENKFSVQLEKRFHLFSPLVYKIFNSETFAAKFSIFDNFFRVIPFFKSNSSNVILSIIKI
jgi:ubiquinone/menaquinone biosynthesis C-methylase UbiE